MVAAAETIQPNELRAQPASRLLERLLEDTSSFAKEELQLVRLELAEKRQAATAAASSFGLATAFGLLALSCLTVLLIAILAASVGIVYASLILTVVYAVVAGILASAARSSVARVGGLDLSRSERHLLGPPPKTTRTLDEEEMRVESARRRFDQTLEALERKTDLMKPLRDSLLGATSFGVAIAAGVRSKSTGDGSN